MSDLRSHIVHAVRIVLLQFCARREQVERESDCHYVFVH